MVRSETDKMLDSVYVTMAENWAFQDLIKIAEYYWEA